MPQKPRNFLFLQGPHGPFFGKLGRALEAKGHSVRKIGFNRGDRFFWPRTLPYTAYRGNAAGWAGMLEDIIKAEHITDIVLYGDARPLHAEAVKAAKAANLPLHCFEEGYLRPFWATYERAFTARRYRAFRDPQPVGAALASYLLWCALSS